MATVARVTDLKSAPTAPVAAPPARFKLVWIIVLMVLLTALGGAGAWFLLRVAAPEAPSAVAKKTEFLASDPWFTVNLREESEGRYLQVGVVFEIAGKGTKDLLQSRLPALRSRIILLGSSKTGRELKTPEGKNTFANEILALAREQTDTLSPTQSIEAVHFSVFVIQ